MRAIAFGIGVTVLAWVAVSLLLGFVVWAGPVVTDAYVTLRRRYRWWQAERTGSDARKVDVRRDRARLDAMVRGRGADVSVRQVRRSDAWLAERGGRR